MSEYTHLDIIIPTFNNFGQLTSCLNSILSNTYAKGNYKIIVVNNGEKEEMDRRVQLGNRGVVIHCGENKGWEGGLLEGLKQSTAPFVMFLNDDTYFPVSSADWIQRLMDPFKDPDVGATGPSSNVVSGVQNIFAEMNVQRVTVPYLIGFAMVVRKEALDKVGGVDASLPGGDDFDLSIRLRDAGYRLVACRDVFVYHHGFQTGKKVTGNYWNSQEMVERTNHALIKKHGFKKWWNSFSMGARVVHLHEQGISEKDVLVSKIKETDTVVDLACGADKIVPWAIGVDRIPKGEVVGELWNSPISQADVVGDIAGDIPLPDSSADVVVARHALEHVVDHLKVVENAYRILKPGGRLIIASPNEGYMRTIPLNLDHVHAFTRESMITLCEHFGFMFLSSENTVGGADFVIVFQKGAK